jgi:hypothetical protein
MGKERPNIAILKCERKPRYKKGPNGPALSSTVFDSFAVYNDKEL